MRATMLTLLAACPLVFGTGASVDAADPPPMPGRSLMTEQERAEHRDRMRSMETEQEREAYRRQVHEQMRERAKAQGQVLPNQPRTSAGGGFGSGGRGGRGR